MKVYWGVEVRLHAFLTSALDEALTLRPLYPQGTILWYALDKRLGGP
jgi:hypothetical protein